MRRIYFHPEIEYLCALRDQRELDENPLGPRLGPSDPLFDHIGEIVRRILDANDLGELVDNPPDVLDREHMIQNGDMSALTTSRRWLLSVVDSSEPFLLGKHGTTSTTHFPNPVATTDIT
jgi:hypothetical protein